MEDLRKKRYLRVSWLLFWLPWFAGSAKPSKKVAQLKAVHFLPGFMDICKDFVELTNWINKQAKGELKIKVLGGPDVIPPHEQAEALRKGIIDCLMCPTEYYKPLLPEATVFHLGMLTPAEERQSGFYDFMVDRHKKFGIFYAGRTRAADPFFVYLKKMWKNRRILKNISTL